MQARPYAHLNHHFRSLIPPEHISLTTLHKQYPMYSDESPRALRGTANNF